VGVAEKFFDNEEFHARVCPAEDRTDPEQGSMIRRYIIWRNKHAADERLREIVNRANVA
jgi:hypothetical protein